MMSLLDKICNGFIEAEPKALFHVTTRVAFMKFNAALKGGSRGIVEDMGCSNTGTLLHQKDNIMSNAVMTICMFPSRTNARASSPQ